MMPLHLYRCPDRVLKLESMLKLYPQLINKPYGHQEYSLLHRYHLYIWTPGIYPSSQVPSIYMDTRNITFFTGTIYIYGHQEYTLLHRYHLYIWTPGIYPSSQVPSIYMDTRNIPFFTGTIYIYGFSVFFVAINIIPRERFIDMFRTLLKCANSNCKKQRKFRD